MEQHDPVGEAVSSSEGDRRDIKPETGATDVGIAYISTCTGQGKAADGMGATHEYTENTGRGNHL